ncbi:hypothetical protein FUT69_05350 [Xylella taiwanensis]|uniref:Uncharacterized protein n=1 Tax=Xylella taiwanensis TaxID=1444770 RepID=Z9JLB5_9GAMM|nr:hypothetical protein [Xylella taiwanensis]AXI82708.1 hypothetical protein AB672_01335 [Xylella taiwanensis]EWS78601.1 hypothetical protein AF72_05025 [Xylella taiwanensis]MCD8455707.1 hypothetical protein [Xylella taiwanensis]MCD8458113.1 hypothetical protein [Xylella taiwanensis]MCD8460249.1 hypothetical protein [Xylella taiwanensis]
MNFHALCRRVERAERLVEQRSTQTSHHWRELQYTWRTSWTPLRIVIAGLGLGFMTGHIEPHITLKTLAGKFSGAQHLIQMLGAISAFFATTYAENDSEQGKPRTSKSAATAHASTSQPAEAATHLSEYA